MAEKNIAFKQVALSMQQLRVSGYKYCCALILLVHQTLVNKGTDLSFADEASLGAWYIRQGQLESEVILIEGKYLMVKSGDESNHESWYEMFA